MEGKMRRILSFLLAMTLLCCTAFATESEEDVSYQDVTATHTDAGNGEKTSDDTPAPTPSPTPTIQQDGTTMVTITATGDLTIGTNYKAYKNLSASIFGKELKKQDGDISFYLRNIKDILADDDLTIVNFEGTLADEVTIPSAKKNNEFLFLAPVEYAQSLKNNSIEAVSLENNHVYDFGEDGYNSTVNALTEQGIIYSNATTLGLYETQGVKIGMLAYQTFNGGYDEIYAKMPADIQNARDQGCGIVIVSYHWGEEKDYYPNDNQQKLGKATIDAGADLVLGHHSHRINPIEEYKGKYIVYSLGNFSFAGNNKPSDMLTFIFQIRFKYRKGELWNTSFRIVPCRISSKQDYNDFAVTPLTETRYIDTVLSSLKKNGSKIDNPVPNYPLEWE